MNMVAVRYWTLFFVPCKTSQTQIFPGLPWIPDSMQSVPVDIFSFQQDLPELDYE